MQRKAMAVAVAVAFAAPAGVLAQGSSVQIYGSLSLSLEGAEAKDADTSGAPAPGTGGSSIRGGNVGGGFANPNFELPARAPARRRRVRTSASAGAKISATAYTWASRQRSTRAMGGIRPERTGAGTFMVVAEQRRVARRAFRRSRPRDLGSALQPQPGPQRRACPIRECLHDAVWRACSPQLRRRVRLRPGSRAVLRPNIGPASASTCFRRATTYTAAEPTGLVPVAHVGWLPWPGCLRRDEWCDEQRQQRWFDRRPRSSRACGVWTEVHARRASAGVGYE